MTDAYGDDPNNWSADQMSEFVTVVLDALSSNGALVDGTTVLGQPAVFYDWVQGDLTLNEVAQIVNRCDRSLMTLSDPWNPGA